ncbi:putative protein (plasmid) [Aquifex aeolicus VF5]|uniref:Uncharacterized protein aq_aa13 n=1 Tax=Aquifex aeolicus (strain VF5) TaxID=224324 RepID=YZ13_AQUAE|nr:RecName: Full=Uncharacterized protein aq_aa13 [Aquifex aeolicus VF5]AAC07958.1 putative protein [Aquifex aeolicus VF5]
MKNVSPRRNKHYKSYKPQVPLKKPVLLPQHPPYRNRRKKKYQQNKYFPDFTFLLSYPVIKIRKVALKKLQKLPHKNDFNLANSLQNCQLGQNATNLILLLLFSLDHYTPLILNLAFSLTDFSKSSNCFINLSKVYPPLKPFP